MTDEQERIAHLLAQALGTQTNTPGEESGAIDAIPATVDYTTEPGACAIMDATMDWAHSNQRARARVGGRR